MSYYDFPHTRNYDTDLGYLIQHIHDWDDELAKKADKDYVDEQLALKADLEYVNKHLDEKVDLTVYNSDMAVIADELEAKVDIDVYKLQISQMDEEIKAKQDTLVSGTNIKTINGNSILGEGNIVIEGGGGTVDIIDDLTSERTDAALSANQGRVLSLAVAAAITECKAYTDSEIGSALTANY